MDILRQHSLPYGSGSAWDSVYGRAPPPPPPPQRLLSVPLSQQDLLPRRSLRPTRDLWIDDDVPPNAFLEIIAERIHVTWNNRRDVRELRDFIQLVVPELECCYATVISALVYMQQLNFKFKGSRIDTTAVSCQQLYMVCLIIASKFVSDMPFTNQQWAEVAGTTLAHVNELERSALSALNYLLMVDVEDYEREKHLLEQLVSARLGFLAPSAPVKRKDTSPLEDLHLPRPAPAHLKQSYNEWFEPIQTSTLLDADAFGLSAALTPQCILSSTGLSERGMGESSVMLYQPPPPPPLHEGRGHADHSRPTSQQQHQQSQGMRQSLAPVLAPKMEAASASAALHHGGLSQAAGPQMAPVAGPCYFAQQQQPGPGSHKAQTKHASAATWADYVADKLGYTRLFGGTSSTAAGAAHALGGASDKMMAGGVPRLSLGHGHGHSPSWKQPHPQRRESGHGSIMPPHCLPLLPIINNDQLGGNGSGESQATAGAMGAVYLPVQHPSKGQQHHNHNHNHGQHQQPQHYAALSKPFAAMNLGQAAAAGVGPGLPLRPLAPRAALVQDTYRAALDFGAF